MGWGEVSLKRNGNVARIGAARPGKMRLTPRGAVGPDENRKFVCAGTDGDRATAPFINLVNYSNNGVGFKL